MTLLEKAMQEHPGMREGKIVSMMCPSDLGYNDAPPLCQEHEEAEYVHCWDCWNRKAVGPADAAGEGGAGNGG